MREIDLRTPAESLSQIWRPHLSADEFCIVSYIVDATFEQGNIALFATFREMASGIPSEPGSQWPWKLPPIGLSKSQFYRALRELKEKGLVDAENMENRRTRLAVWPDWMPEASKAI